MKEALLPADRAPVPDVYDLPLRPVGQWTLVWRRFRRHRLAVWGLRIFVLMCLLAVIGPSLVPFGLTTHILDANKGPRLWPLDLRRLMGTDDYGAAVSTYVFDGARPMLVIGVMGSLIASLVGIAIGGIAGYFGRLVDTLLMRITDAFLAIPFVPLLILLSLYLTDHGVIAYALLFGLVGWPGIARLVRGYVLSLRQREYAEAARALGAADPVVIFRHLVPNALDVIVVSFTLNVAVFIVAEVTLEFLGAPPDTITWGQGMAYAYRSGLLVSNNAWWIAFFPGFPLLLTVLAVNFIGDGLRDALDTTSTTLIFDKAYRPSLTWRLLAWAARPAVHGLALGRAHLAAAVARLELTQRRERLAARVPWLSAATTSGRVIPLHRLYRTPPKWLRFGPPLAVLAVCGTVFLFQHSPLRYAPHFPPPATYAVTQGAEEYGAVARPHGGWDLFHVTPAGTLAYDKIDAAGHLMQQQTTGSGSSASAPALAEGHGTALGVWASGDGSTMEAAYLGGSGTPRTFTLTPSTGSVEHPTVVAVPGGFDVLFTWQRPQDNAQSIWLATLRHGRRSAALHLLIANKVHGFYPRAALDGSGALDVVWIDRTTPDRWAIRFRRFTPAGRPLSRTTTLDGFEYYIPGPPGKNVIPAVPVQWALDVQRAPDGSVWAAWEGNQNQGGDWISVAQWTRTGHLTLPPTQVVQGGFDAAVHALRALGLAITANGGQLYFTGENIDGGIGSVPYMQPFDRNGNPIGLQQRVAYDGGGTAANPHAATVAGRPQAVWEKTALHATTLEGTAYRAATIPPGLLVRMGLNVGNLATNILFLVLGSLAGGLGIAAVNPIVLFVLILLWLPVGWIVPRRLRWMVYLALIGLVLARIFGSGGSPPPYVIFIDALGSPGGWIAVAAAIFITFWAGQLIFRRLDPLFRAATMAVTSIYVIGALYAVIYVQGEITKI